MSFSSFKNIRFYRLSAPLPFNAEQFAQALEQFRFTHCLAQEATKSGFFQPLHKSVQTLAYVAGQLIVFAVKQEKKPLSNKAVMEQLSVKVDALELEYGRPLSRKEKRDLKDEIILSLLPRCIPESNIVTGYYDTARNIIAIGSSSSSKCEDVLALLRKALGSLPALPFFDAHALANKLQMWGKNQDLPGGFEIGAKMEFQSPAEDGSKARFDNHLLTHEEVQAHFQDKLATKLELVKLDEMTFTLNDNGAITGIKYNDKLVATNDEMGYDDLIARLDADMLLLSDSLGKVIDVFMQVVPYDMAAAKEETPAAEQSSDAGHDDKLFPAAKEFVITSRRASVSALQRHLRIGYNWAARLMEELERQGVVSVPGHNGNREVLQ